MHQNTIAIIRGAGAYFTATVIGSAGTFLVSLIISWQFGREGLGIFAVVMTVVLIGVVLSEMGLNPYILRTYSGAEAEDTVPFRSIILFRGGASVLVAVALGLGAAVMVPEPSAFPLVAAAALLIVSRSVGGGLENFIKAQRRLSAIFHVTLASAIIQVAATYAGSKVFSHVGPLILLLALVDLFRTGVLAVLCRKELGGHPVDGLIDSEKFRSVLRLCVPFMAIGFMSLVAERVDLILLASMRDSATAGIYAAADRFLVVVAFIDGSVIASTLPIFRRTGRGGEHQAVAGQLIMAGFGLSLIVAVTLYFGSTALIRSTFHFEESVNLLQLLALAIPAMIVSRTLRSVLYANHQERAVAWIFGGSALVGIILNILFIPQYGAVAPAAITIALEYAVAVAFGALYYKTREIRIVQVA